TAQLFDHLSRCAGEGAPLVQGQRDLAKLKAGHQLGKLAIRAGFQLCPRVTPLGVLSHQRRAISRLISAVFAVQGFHGTGFVLGWLFLANQLSERGSYLRLPPLDLHRIKHALPLLLDWVSPIRRLLRAMQRVRDRACCPIRYWSRWSGTERR